MFRITISIPCTRAVAVSNASRSERGSGTCSRAHRSATVVSIGRVRSANSDRTWGQPGAQSRTLNRVAPLHSQDADFQFHQGDGGNKAARCVHARQLSGDAGVGLAVFGLAQFGQDAGIEVHQGKSTERLLMSAGRGSNAISDRLGIARASTRSRRWLMRRR